MIGLKTSQLLFEPIPDNSSPFLSKNVRDTVYPDNLSKFFTLLTKWILHSYHQQNGPRKATPSRNIQKSSITIIPSCPLLKLQPIHPSFTENLFYEANLTLPYLPNNPGSMWHEGSSEISWRTSKCSLTWRPPENGMFQLQKDV